MAHAPARTHFVCFIKLWCNSHANKGGSRRGKKVVSAGFWNFCLVDCLFFPGHLFGLFHSLHVFLCLFFVCPSLSLFLFLFLSPIFIFSLPFSHVTRGYNIVADRWTEASNPHPNLNLSLSLSFCDETHGYNIIADRWTKASNPHPHPNLNHHTQASRPLVFPLFHSARQTDQQINRWTDGKSISYNSVQSWNERDTVLPGCTIITWDISKFK